MATPYSRAPHVGGFTPGGAEAPHAAMLIDFDNVTMGMRSDLSRELKSLLDSDVIKGKVSVQRAYADWRRYPQYIVPLSEASVDLIFAPAYGSNKKNATDIRMAIDAVELVFIRPEIGTYILLTGDSDFSSLVLKLKEYGKYVIGVGIQESSSDILVQNCDEYYSYTSLTGLRKTTETDHKPIDPWVLVTEALKKMVTRNDVMRSDRLKQVMQEMDPNFDEGGIGFSKFSRFLAEASSRGVVQLKKLENGQYEVSPQKGRGRRSEGSGRSSRGRDRDRSRRGRREQPAPQSPEEPGSDPVMEDDPLQGAYDLLTRALTGMHDAGREAVRDSDVKRKLLELDRSFDEAELGFPKFSKFLGQAADHGIVTLTRTERGNFEVRLAPEGTAVERQSPDDLSKDVESIVGAGLASEDAAAADEDRQESPEPEASAAPAIVEFDPSRLDQGMLRLGPRRGTTRRRDGESLPFFDGQIVGAVTSPTARSAEPQQERPAEPKADRPVEPKHERPVETKAERPVEPKQERPAETKAERPVEPKADWPPQRQPDPKADRDDAPGAATRQESSQAEGAFDAGALGLPTESAAIGRYLTHRYKGVGDKTAESLVERFGSDVFRVMRDDPDAITAAVPGRRGEQVLEAWESDYERRTAQAQGTAEQSGSGSQGGRRGGRRR